MSDIVLYDNEEEIQRISCEIWPDGAIMTLGRGEGTNIYLPYKEDLSRHHLSIRREGHSFIIHDAGSTNGTYFMGNPIEEPTHMPPNVPFYAASISIVLIDTPPNAMPLGINFETPYEISEDEEQSFSHEDLDDADFEYQQEAPLPPPPVAAPSYAIPEGLPLEMQQAMQRAIERAQQQEIQQLAPQQAQELLHDEAQEIRQAAPTQARPYEGEAPYEQETENEEETENDDLFSNEYNSLIDLSANIINNKLQPFMAVRGAPMGGIPQNFNIEAYIGDGSGILYEGDNMSFNIQADCACHIMIMSQDEEGASQTLYPNRFHRKDIISGKQWVTLPDDEEPLFDLEIGPPYGTETIQIIAKEAFFNKPGEIQKVLPRWSFCQLHLTTYPKPQKRAKR